MKFFYRTLILSICIFHTNTYAAYMEWDWEISEFNVSSDESIKMWGVLTNTASFSLGIEMSGYSYDPGTLIVTTIANADNPYTMQFNYSVLDTLNFFDDRLMSGDSARFLFGTLTPNENIAPGSYSTGTFSLSFRNSPSSTDPQALSNITVNVSTVPLPAATWLFGSGLIGLVGFAKRKKA